jgi:hypothetical protein
LGGGLHKESLAEWPSARHEHSPTSLARLPAGQPTLIYAAASWPPRRLPASRAVLRAHTPLGIEHRAAPSRSSVAPGEQRRRQGQLRWESRVGDFY